MAGRGGRTTGSGGRGRGGRGGRGEGGRGRGGRGEGGRGVGVVAAVNAAPYVASGKIRTGVLPASVDDMIPTRFLAPATGWEEKQMKKEKYELLTEEEYNSKYHKSDNFINSYLHAAESIERHLRQRGLAVNTVNVITFLISERVFLDLSIYASEVLVKGSLSPTTPAEIQQFLATKLLRSRFRIPSAKVWTAVMEPIAKQHGFPLMNIDRYNNILNSIRGYKVNARSGDNGDDVWIQHHKLLRNLNEMEKNIFENSFSVLFDTKNGSLVVDDELVSSCAGDVESKVVSDKKKGKNGPVFDGVADSNTGCLYGSRLRVSGEPQRQNVQKLLQTAPTITNTNHHPRLALDRGYSSEEAIAAESLRAFSVTTINNSASRNPFLPRDDVDEVINRQWRSKKYFQKLDDENNPIKEEYLDDKGQKRKRNMLDEVKVKPCKDIFEKWILSDNSMYGAEVRVATKDVNSDGKNITLTAFAIHDIFDKKAATKHLRFLATGNESRETNNIWVASNKTNMNVTSNHLFSNKPASAERKRVEDVLTRNGCSALTIGQRCMDWFILKSMIFTGTIGGIVYSAAEKILEQQDGLSQDTIDFDDDLHHDLLRDVFNKSIESWFGRGRASTTAMAQGTKNEEPTLQCFRQMDCVKALFEVGLLKWKSEGIIGVSPDGIAVVTIPGDDHNDLDEQIVCVEVKTRVAENTIAAAEDAREWARNHSVDGDGNVVCEYDDDVFKKCVPSANRKQVIATTAASSASIDSNEAEIDMAPARSLQEETSMEESSMAASASVVATAASAPVVVNETENETTNKTAPAGDNNNKAKDGVASAGNTKKQSPCRSPLKKKQKSRLFGLW